ncbi:lantibiotic dehydratase [Streptomyces vinaceus]|uniref:lantibiotic dehydratase n=1 Tax=Streptomyces vinaceus TaxID=1960 RepID=UPI003688DAC1
MSTSARGVLADSVEHAAGLYTPLQWALVRLPLLSVDEAICVNRAGDSLAPCDPRVRAAISVASSSLMDALIRTRRDDWGAERIRAKLMRYLIRMSTRPTPFGLFSGVSLSEWGEVTDLALANCSPRTRTRPDMEWLLDFITALENDESIRPSLTLRLNPAFTTRGGRILLTRHSISEVSVLDSPPIRRVLELARQPILYESLVDELCVSLGEAAAPRKAQRLIDEMWRQGFLYSDLRPPLTGMDPSLYVRERLSRIPAAVATTAAGRLESLSIALREWDGRDLKDRVAGWPSLINQVRSIHEGAASKNVLQTDMALPLVGTRMNASVGAEAARAGELLLRMSPLPYGPPHIERYRRAFESRYGPVRMVPLLELLDPDFGLGLPRDDEATAPVFPQREHVLRELALDANRNRRLVVELDDTLLGQLQTWTPQLGSAPLSMEISVYVTASSAAAVDAGAFNVVVGPGVGGAGAGRSVGRFAGLLGPPAEDALAQIAVAEAALAPNLVRAEVVHIPQRPRLANVAIRPAARRHEIVFSTLPGVADTRVISLNELVVGVSGSRFTVVWPNGDDMEIVGVQGNMLNPMLAPDVARFLLDVANDGFCQLSHFDWGPARSFPFLPRVQCGRIVLSLAQWRIDPVAEDLAIGSVSGFADALTKWRTCWCVPRYVYLTVGDNRLLLDLDELDHIELLRGEIKNLPEGNRILLQEGLPNPQQAWVPGRDGMHIAEFIVPIMASESVAEPMPRSAPGGPTLIPSRVRVRPPGSDWLYLKIYVPPSLQDDLIAGPMCNFSEFAGNAGLSDAWFFLRFADPDPHLRLRFHGTPAALTGPLMQKACDWATELMVEGKCSRFSFDTYEREVERYGGEEGVRAAEAVFAADSPAVVDMIRVSRDLGFPFDLTTLAVLSVDDLLGSLGWNADERTDFYRLYARKSKLGGEEFRRRKHQLRQLLSAYESVAVISNCEELTKVMARRRAVIEPQADLLESLERNGLLCRSSRSELCRQLIHLHVNRLLGIGSAREQLVLELLRRTREGLRRAPNADGAGRVVGVVPEGGA